MSKIKGYSNLKKEGGIVKNTDYSAYLRAKERKAEKNKINNLEDRLDRIESLLLELIKESK